MKFWEVWHVTFDTFYKKCGFDIALQQNQTLIEVIIFIYKYMLWHIRPLRIFPGLWICMFCSIRWKLDFCQFCSITAGCNLINQLLYTAFCLSSVICQNWPPVPKLDCKQSKIDHRCFFMLTLSKRENELNAISWRSFLSFLFFAGDQWPETSISFFF